MRRPSVTALCLAALVLLAGCSIGAPPRVAEKPPGARLGSVEIRNVDTEPHTVDVLVERNDADAYRTTRRVAGERNGTIDGAILVPGRFVDRPGEYVIHVRLDDASSGERFALSNVSDAGCYVVQVRIEEEGTVAFAASEGVYECRRSATTAAP